MYHSGLLKNKTISTIEAHLAFLYLIRKGRKQLATGKLDRIKSLVLYARNFALNKTSNRKQDLSHIAETNILFVATEKNQMEHLLPVMEQLHRGQVKIVLYSPHEHLLEMARQRGILCLDHCATSVTRWHQPLLALRELKKNRVVHYKQVWRYLLREIFTTDQLIAFFKEVYAAAAIKAVVVGNDLTVQGRIAVMLAKSQKITSFSLQHGAIIKEPGFQDQHLVDHFMVYGEVSRQQLLASGMPEEKVTVTGFPVQEEKRTLKTTFFEGLFADPYRPLVLTAFSGPGHVTSEGHFKKIMALLDRVLGAHRDFNVLLKLHPKEKPEWYEANTGFHKHPHVKMFPYSSLPEELKIPDPWLTEADWIITGNSTVAVEAMKVGKPVITIDLDGEYEDKTDFIQYGATLHFSESSTFEDFIRDKNFKRLDETRSVAAEFVRQYYSTDIPNPVANYVQFICEKSSLVCAV